MDVRISPEDIEDGIGVGGSARLIAARQRRVAIIRRCVAVGDGRGRKAAVVTLRRGATCEKARRGRSDGCEGADHHRREQPSSCDYDEEHGRRQGQ